jgi:3-hydroxyacyl-CoA dehydrogenase
MYIYKAGVVGAGQMGAGITQVITFAGLPVVLKDISQEFLDKGLSQIKKIYDSRIKKGRMTPEDVQTKLSLITTTTKYDEFSDVDIVIEAVPEDMELKKKVFAELNSACPPHTILATNTSALSISAIAKASGRPEKVIGMHFFYPAPVMRLVEVIPALQTSQDTIETTIMFAETLRKIPVKLKECPGFLVNRILMPYLYEAVYCLQEGAAERKQIDDKAREFGLPMGPFTLMDNLGLDICYHVTKIMHEAYGQRAKPPELVEQIYQNKLFGVKSGAGFYVYMEDKKDLIPEFISQIQQKTGKKGTKFTIQRLIYPMINEAVMCLDEGIASATDIDIALLAGIGFPQKTKGLLHYADSIGLDVVLNELIELEKEHGERFHPAVLLRRMVDAGYLGQKTKKGFFDYT